VQEPEASCWTHIKLLTTTCSSSACSHGADIQLEADLLQCSTSCPTKMPHSLRGFFLFFWFFFFFFFFLVFRDRVSLCSPGCPGTHFVDQAGLKLRDPPVSASHMLELKAPPPPGIIYGFIVNVCFGF
jgi:hypothetical protein